MYVCVPFVYMVPSEARRGCKRTWNCSYIRMWTAICVLEIDTSPQEALTVLSNAKPSLWPYDFLIVKSVFLTEHSRQSATHPIYVSVGESALFMKEEHWFVFSDFSPPSLPFFVSVQQERPSECFFHGIQPPFPLHLSLLHLTFVMASQASVGV